MLKSTKSIQSVLVDSAGHDGRGYGCGLVCFGFAGLIDISCRVVNRLNGFHSATQEVPDAFRHIKAQVPIAIDSLRRTQADALAGGVDLETQNALKPTMEGCKSVIQRMDKILGKILPVETDSFWKKTTKVIRSLRQEREIETLLQELHRYLAGVTLHNTSGNRPATLPTLQRVVMIPGNRDPNFVDRPDLFSELEANLDANGRTALAGMGGVG